MSCAGEPKTAEENALVLLMNLVNAAHRKPEDEPSPSHGELVGSDMRHCGGEWRLILWVKNGITIDTFVIHESAVRGVTPDAPKASNPR